MGKDGAARAYVLAGLVQCRRCGRRMDSHWVNGRAGYRCRHGYNSASVRPLGAPRSLYVREDVLLRWLEQRHDPVWPLLATSEGLDVSAEAANRLRAESRVIVCGRGDWTITVVR